MQPPEPVSAVTCARRPAAAIAGGGLGAALARSRESAWRMPCGENPQRRLIELGEAAAVVLYLCSDAARGINGEALVIDGGDLRR